LTGGIRPGKLLGRMPVRRLIVLLVSVLSLLFASSAQAFVYWGDFQDGTIGRANLDGTNVEDAFIQTGGHPIGVAVNSTYIYWANESAGTIGRAKLDGTVVEPNFITGINKPWGVAVTPTAIFWPSFGGDEIGRANLDGSGKNLGLVTGVNSPCSIAVDSGHIYWGSTNLTSFIGRSSLTGSSPEREWVNLGTYVPCGMATNSANIFFADTGSFGPAHEIGRVNINGTGLDKSIIGEAEGPCGLSVFGSRLFWANNATDTIGVANTDATGVNESLIQTGGKEICGVAVDSLSSPPIPPPASPGGGDGAASSPPPVVSPSPPTPGAIRLSGLKPNLKRGTAQLKLEVNQAGIVSLTGKGIAPTKATAHGAGPVSLTVRATKAKAATLAQTGKLPSKLTVTFVPGNGGASAVLGKSVTLREHQTK
jgi:virginiamycin B lyase